MKTFAISLCSILTLVSSPIPSNETLRFEIDPPKRNEEGITVNFQDVSVTEFLRFVSKVAEVNFIYDDTLLDFKISLVTGKPTNPENILSILFQLLEKQGIKAEEREGCYLVEKMEEWEIAAIKEARLAKLHPEIKPSDLHLISNKGAEAPILAKPKKKEGDFFVYKLQYHVGSEIMDAVKKVGSDIAHGTEGSTNLLQTIRSMQWMQSTNSLLYSGNEENIAEVTKIVESLDVPKKQVFIEVLVIETDVRNSLDFGLEWGGGGKYRDKFGYGLGNFPLHSKGNPSFAQNLSGINATNTPTGTNQFPIGSGFDLGVIGDIILHKGMSYFSLGSLVSALEADGNTSIILNQKIITQDNKLSTVFVGDNIPFTGSVVQTVGASQQTASNIEYRDVGVKLNITPLLGEGDVITLDISEEITEAVDDVLQKPQVIGGIQTTKTDMNTQVHVPDKSFLVLSGMMRNTKKSRKTGIPCLGGLPVIGAAFSKTATSDEKRNVIVFVRPHIVNSAEQYQTITAKQEQQYREQSGNKKAFDEGIDNVKEEGNPYGQSCNGEHEATQHITANRAKP